MTSDRTTAYRRRSVAGLAFVSLFFVGIAGADHDNNDGFSGGGTAAFILNFQPNPNERVNDDDAVDIAKYLNFNCNRPAASGEFEDCDDNHEFRDNNGRDRTPFLYELLRGDGGQLWYHVVIGLPGDDFVQEMYIQTRSCCREGGDIGPDSDSQGQFGNIEDVRVNAYDPRGPSSFGGSGTGNPKSTFFRQLLGDAEFSQDFVKAELNRKPILSQDMSTADISVEFLLDMSNSTYDDMTTPATIAARQQIFDPSFADMPPFPTEFPGDVTPPAPDQFDVAFDAAQTNVTGGLFRYVTYGVYEGPSVGFDIFEADWNAFYDPAQNVGHLYGPEGKDD